jgi:integrase
MLIRRNKIWHYQTKIHGKTFRRSTGQTDRREAQRKALEFRKSVQLRKSLSASSRASTLHAAIAEETQRIEADVGPRQAERAGYCFLNFAKWMKNDVPLETLPPDVLQIYQRHRVQDSDVAGATVRKEVHVLFRMLHDYIPGIRKPKPIAAARVHPNRAFTDSELQAIFAALKSQGVPSRFYDLCLVLVTTGARLAEIVPSTRSSHIPLLKVEVHHEEGCITIRTAKQRDSNRADPRIVLVPPETLDALRRQSEETFGQHVFQPRVNAAHAFRMCLKRAKVPYLDGLGRKATLHSFRHTYATKMAEIVGQNAFILRAVLGHRQFGTTAHYCRPAAPPVMADLSFLKPLATIEECQKGCQGSKPETPG